ncbi:hypothetical protein EVAR_8997_1 [Eumeta japonica]|uniref:Uncharacterized protein n=1 Tax=Eumeta variegata TaxID=151549 RepID=A0A4C1WQT6_EUMVA|nr:hypothetical protein EVAR_8997_1 [Eumeta japonica]
MIIQHCLKCEHYRGIITLWSTWLGVRKWAVRWVRHHTLTEYGREVTFLVLSFVQCYECSKCSAAVVSEDAVAMQWGWVTLALLLAAGAGARRKHYKHQKLGGLALLIAAVTNMVTMFRNDRSTCCPKREESGLRDITDTYQEI